MEKKVAGRFDMILLLLLISFLRNVTLEEEEESIHIDEEGSLILEGEVEDLLEEEEDEQSAPLDQLSSCRGMSRS